MLQPSVLIVDDETAVRENLAKYLSSDYITYTASNGSDAIKIIEENSDIEVVLSDMKMPEMDGIELLDTIQGTGKDIVTIFVTGFSTIESAVNAMRKGAYDYLTKPIDLNKLEITLKNAIEHKKLKSENILLRQQIREKFDATTLIGNSAKIKEIIDLVKRVASTRATILIQGESGTGKELVANIIHYNSSVVDGPFIKVNCSALAEGVLESELFGHEKGAFTGALYMKKGRFELADGGTLFLDEIGDLPPSIQVKLLRFLQESEFERVGGTKTLKVDVRIISATNKDLEKLVTEEKFRDDLFYRLNVVSVEVPPLRERKEDIPPIINYHLNKFAEIHNKKISGISKDAMKLIKSYSWPGNIRELMNCIESAVVVSVGDTVTANSLPPFLTSSKTSKLLSSQPDDKLFEIEKKAILDALEKTNGNKAEASRVLGIGLRTLYRKLKQYNVKG
ncbi:MAG: sigma-54-dependent Fis family transcriptional regulator [Nitrospiraceae bacterium]|nr:MAG: sigma-54-dependent Fis family transcriptional regulator [Nitrospiraceae bacterium]